MSGTRSPALAEDLYLKLTDEEDARVCEDISDDACIETPQNFLLILLSHFFTKLGDAVASPKTVLAWVTTAVGAPAFVLGLLVPVRESGSMIPQLFIGGVIRRMPVRKWVWVAGSLAQALCILGIGVVVMTLSGRGAGWAILSLVVLFSLARGFCSVAAKDVLGKTIPKRKRGQLTGWSASAAGLVTLGVALFLILSPRDSQLTTLGWLLVGAGTLWLVAALIYSRVREYAGETAGGGNAVAEAVKRLSILRDDKPFRRFVMARALLMCSALSAPFYVALAQGALGSVTYLLGLFVLADGLASLVSAPVWGKAADRSSKRVMLIAALITATTGVVVFAADLLLPGVVGTPWFVPAAYFVLCIAHNGVRVGRKTYVVDLASGNRRTDYVAVSNSVIGVLLLVVGFVGSLVPLLGYGGVIAVLALLGFAGALLSCALPEV
jgi:MFS family permease